MKNVYKYILLWIKLTENSFLVSFTSWFNASIFFLSKFLRFILFLVFLISVLTKIEKLNEYTMIQTVFFFLTFNTVDTITQLFYREVYRFRPLIVSGDFDLVLVKPMSPLFRALAGGADPLDLLMLIPYIGALLYCMILIPGWNSMQLIMYILLLINGFIIATGFHILVLSLAIMTTEIDHAIMIYRDLTSMGRVPVDIYSEPLRALLTFVVPVGIMMTFPAKAFLGLLSTKFEILSFCIGILFLLGVMRIWRFALTKYASASS